MQTIAAVATQEADILGGDRPVRELPDRVVRLLERCDAPLRLVAHLRHVHDVAADLTDWVRSRDPGPAFDPELVRFGAATHDIGKARHFAELSGPGKLHEEAGRALLIELGVPEREARFAATHSSWAADSPLEDLLVSVADTVWKGARVAALEDLVIGRLAEASGEARWAEYLALDGFLAEAADDADRRLRHQMLFPIGR